MDDLIDRAISREQKKVYKLLKQVYDAGVSTRKAMSLGETICDSRREVENLVLKDPRIEKFLSDIEDKYVKLLRGEDPFKS